MLVVILLVASRSPCCCAGRGHVARGVEPVGDELNVGLLVLVSYRAIEQRVFRALAAAGFDDFTPSQARVMRSVRAARA